MCGGGGGIQDKSASVKLWREQVEHTGSKKI